MKNHCISKENLILFIDGELPEEKILSAEKHLQKCHSCQKEFKLLEAIDSAITGMKSIEPSDKFDTEFWGALDSALKSSSLINESSKQVKWKPYAAACMAAMIFIIGGLSIFSLNDSVFSLNDSGSGELAIIEDIEMLQDFDIAINLDLLENWDSLIAMEDNS